MSPKFNAQNLTIISFLAISVVVFNPMKASAQTKTLKKCQDYTLAEIQKEDKDQLLTCSGDKTKRNPEGIYVIDIEKSKETRKGTKIVTVDASKQDIIDSGIMTIHGHTAAEYANAASPGGPYALLHPNGNMKLNDLSGYTVDTKTLDGCKLDFSPIKADDHGNISGLDLRLTGSSGYQYTVRYLPDSETTGAPKQILKRSSSDNNQDYDYVYATDGKANDPTKPFIRMTLDKKNKKIIGVNYVNSPAVPPPYPQMGSGMGLGPSGMGVMGTGGMGMGTMQNAGPYPGSALTGMGGYSSIPSGDKGCGVNSDKDLIAYAKRPVDMPSTRAPAANLLNNNDNRWSPAMAH